MALQYLHARRHQLRDTGHDRPAEVQGLDACQRKEGDLAVRDGERIGAGAAIDTALGEAAGQQEEVVADAARAAVQLHGAKVERVVALAARQRVGVVAAGQAVIARTAIQAVIARAARQRLCPRRPEQCVVRPRGRYGDMIAGHRQRPHCDTGAQKGQHSAGFAREARDARCHEPMRGGGDGA